MVRTKKTAVKLKSYRMAGMLRTPSANSLYHTVMLRMSKMVARMGLCRADLAHSRPYKSKTAANSPTMTAWS